MLGALRGCDGPCRLGGREENNAKSSVRHRKPASMAKVAAILAVAAPEAPAAAKHLKVHTVSTMSETDVKKCIARPRVDFQSILQTVSPSCKGSKTSCRVTQPSEHDFCRVRSCTVLFGVKRSSVQEKSRPQCTLAELSL